jgi:hypothetical protein
MNYRGYGRRPTPGGRHADARLRRHRPGRFLASGPPVPLLPGIVDSPDTEVRPAFSPDGRCVLWARSPRRRRTGRSCRPAAPVNCSEAINNGPAVDPNRPGVLFYSAHCPALGLGRMDIFEVPTP